jgi:hypothetical protein
VIKSSQARQPDDLGVRGWLFFDGSPGGRVAESSVDALAVVVLDVLEEEASKVLLGDRDGVVEELATHGSNPALGEAVLPQGAVGRRLRFDSELLDPITACSRRERNKASRLATRMGVYVMTARISEAL